MSHRPTPRDGWTVPAEFKDEPSATRSPILKPAAASADATISFADVRQVVSKAGPDVTVSLAETPARVPVPSQRPSQATTSARPRAQQSKTLFGLPMVSPTAAAAPAAASQAPKATSAASAAMNGGAPAAAVLSPAAKEAAPPEGAFAANTPAHSRMFNVPKAREEDRTQDVSLSDISLLEAAANPPDVPTMIVAEQREVEARGSELDLDAAPPPVFERHNAPSTEPAPRPRSALKYGVWAAVPVGLCAAWFAWQMPTSESRLNTKSVVLRSEQAPPSELPSAPAQPALPAALAPAAETAPEATKASEELAPSEAAAGRAAGEGVEPGAEAQELEKAEVVAPAATAEAAGESEPESDPDMAGAGEEVEGSRKAVTAKADKLVSEGHALRKKRKLAPARAKYRDALAIYPGYPRALAGLVQVSIQQRDGKAAVNLAKQLVKLRPGEVSYLVLLGDAYKVAGKPGLARETWQSAARKGSGAAKARLGD